MDVAIDSMTLRAVASFERRNLSGHMTEPVIQTARFKASLAGRIWKTMTQIILTQSQSLRKDGEDQDGIRRTLNQRKLPLSCLGLFFKTP